MTTVLKTLTERAPEGAEKLYRHALVEHGTLAMFDFSNGGTTDAFDVSNGANIYDLARDSSLLLGIDNQGVSQRNIVDDSSLTPGRGFTNIHNTTGSGRGIVFGTDLMSYLATNTPHAYGSIIFRANPALGGNFDTDRYVFAVVDEGNIFVNQNNIQLQISPSYAVSFRFGLGNIAFGDIPSIGGDLVHIGIEVGRGDGKVHIYHNGVYLKEKEEVYSGFEPPTNYSKIGFIQGNTVPVATYIFQIEDLGVSGRTALDLAEKQWNYANSLSLYQGMPKRSFTDTY